MIYFDNAATTYPKPRGVVNAVFGSFEQYSANPGRSGHKLSMKAAMKVFECRDKLKELFNAQDAADVVFTQNCTHSLNIFILGLLKSGDHVIISDLEHNSVLRPVHMLSETGVIRYSIAETVPGDEEQTAKNFEKLINPATRLIVTTHGSNAFGIRLPISLIAKAAKRNGVMFGVDAAQTAGIIPIDMQESQIDFLAMPGHKGLYGPMGTGVLITPHGEKLRPLTLGGTGTFSALYSQPATMPEFLESGTIAVNSIAGLSAGVDFVKFKGINRLCLEEKEVAGYLYSELEKLDFVKIYSPNPHKMDALPVVTFNVDNVDSEKAAAFYDSADICVRAGLHCAPLAHKKMGTIETGAVRASIGAFNSKKEVDRFVRYTKKLQKFV